MSESDKVEQTYLKRLEELGWQGRRREMEGTWLPEKHEEEKLAWTWGSLDEAVARVKDAKESFIYALRPEPPRWDYPFKREVKDE